MAVGRVPRANLNRHGHEEGYGQVMVRVDGGRYGMGAELPDEGTCRPGVGDEGILEVHRVEMTMTRMVERGQGRKQECQEAI